MLWLIEELLSQLVIGDWWIRTPLDAALLSEAENLVDGLLGSTDTYSDILLGQPHSTEPEDFAVVGSDTGHEHDLPVICICTVMQCMHIIIQDSGFQLAGIAVSIAPERRFPYAGLAGNPDPEYSALAKKAAADDTDVTFTMYPGISHDFALLLPELQDSVDSFKEIRDFVNRHLQ